MKKELIILLVVGALAAAFFAGRTFERKPTPVVAKVAAKPESPPTPAPKAKPLVETTKVSRHPSRGPEDALVTIVEISDFQCPFCSKGRATVEALQKEHPQDVRVVFIHLPLSFHDHARSAAIASMAAHRQGKFWELYAKFFADQRKLAPAAVLKTAAALGLDMARFKRDIADAALAEQVADDTAIANSLGVSGTPAYFINGVQISGAQPKEKVAAVLNAQLKRADQLLQQGTPRHKLHLRMWRRNNPAKADAAIDWIIRGGKPPKSARPKPQKKGKGPGEAKKPATKKPIHPAKDKTVWKVSLSGDEPTRGPTDALLTLVIFTDFQCPFCSRVRPAIAQVEKSYAGKVRLVFKNQPLSFHKLAPLAAEAGLCAHAQGKFWQMEEQLFSHQRELAPAELQAHAKAIGLHPQKFAQCLQAHTQRAVLNRDIRQAAELEVNGTPTVFVNGRKVGGAQPYGVFARVIEQELDRAKKALAGGTPATKLYEELIARGKLLKVRAELGEKTFNFDNAGSPRLGSPSAPIQLVVFEDLQCPFCARFSATLAAVRRKYGERVSVVFKHLPLSNQCNAAMGRDMHPAACRAAFWAMAAHDQDKFWTFTKRIFGDMTNLIPAGDELDKRLAALDVNLQKHAKAAGIDVAKASQYIQEQKFAKVMERDIREAAQLRITGTPSIFINGREYNGPLSLERIAAAAKRTLGPTKTRAPK